MSINCNGANKLSRNGTKKRENGDKCEKDIPGYCKENIETEAFKGFAKVPRVLLSRYDITPYLKNKSKYPNLCNKYDKVDISYPLHIKRILQDCSVKIERYNLDLLQNSLPRSPRSDISISELDEIGESMANLKCKICDKVYASEKKLLNHQENKHMIVYKPELKPQKRVSFSDHIIIHEVKEYHKCRKCTKIFEDYKSLKLHMKRRHKKRKCYICHYCDKNFVDRMFFKVHIKLHCDVCGLLLPSKSKYIEHRRNVCRVFKMHNCKTCNTSFFKFMDLKDHSYEHLSTLYVCDICKDQFETKCAVSHHISFLHSKKRPTALFNMRNLGNERLYLCNFCEESSVDRDIIDTHLQTLPDLSNRAMTGYKDYYFCDQCLMKFDTEQNMLQHKWTHFLKTSDNSQVRPKDVTSTHNNETKVRYNVNNKIPEHMMPSVVVDRLNVNEENIKEYFENKNQKRQIKKTLFSKHQCQNCGKYYSSNYCLNRHIETQHCDYEELRCKVCEETFVWPSLLRNHKCIRLNLPEMPFDDARPEIHFDNLHEISQNGFDDFNITDSDDYMNSVDFEIPAPIVELHEGNQVLSNNVDRENSLQSLGYKVVMQEVPIEF